MVHGCDALGIHTSRVTKRAIKIRTESVTNAREAGKHADSMMRTSGPKSQHNALKVARVRRGQSYVTFNTLARVEKGDLPSLANFPWIAEWLGHSPEVFFQPLTRPLATSRAWSLGCTPASPGRRRLSEYGRVAPTFKPEASRLLGELLQDMQGQTRPAARLRYRRLA
jgi:transcriptional regulator with XRE-family HTH domain